MFWLGIGCKRDTQADVINRSIQQLCRDYSLKIQDLQGIATLETKANESGIITICRLYNLPIRLFSAQVLAQVSVTNQSTQVLRHVNTQSVAEAAAIMAVYEQLKLSNLPDIKMQCPVLFAPKTTFRQTDFGIVSFVTLAIAGVMDGEERTWVTYE